MPTVSIARELAARGHEIRFVTDQSQVETLARWTFARIPRGAHDGPSFDLAHWSDPLHVSMQFAHLEYAVEQFAPDIIVASQLTLGPVALCARRQMPLVVVGPIVYLWPIVSSAADIDAQRCRAAAWRDREFRGVYRAACAELRLPADESLLFGSRYLLQSVPVLDPQMTALLPRQVRQIGACALESPQQPPTRELDPWIEAQRAAGRPVAFVQLGRTFGVGDPWPVITAWAAAAGVALVASLQRYDAPIPATRGHYLIRNGIALDGIVPRVDFVICTGTPSPLLAAATAGKPTLIATCGSGTEEHAGVFARYGAGLAFEAAAIDAETLAHLVRRICTEPIFAQRARTLQEAYRTLDGPRLAADEVEFAAGVPA